jgi:peptidyl-tRNA hydrolase
VNPLDPECHDQDNILACYIILNGSLNMSAGKACAQAFQACQRLLTAYKRGTGSRKQRADLREWRANGTRTICRIANTEHLFARCCHELDGVALIDEGLTEIPTGSITFLATWPIRRGQAPRLLRHKNIPLLGHLPAGNDTDRHVRRPS